MFTSAMRREGVRIRVPEKSRAKFLLQILPSESSSSSGSRHWSSAGKVAPPKSPAEPEWQTRDPLKNKTTSRTHLIKMSETLHLKSLKLLTSGKTKPGQGKLAMVYLGNFLIFWKPQNRGSRRSKIFKVGTLTSFHSKNY
jgi:hypothetical protein